MIGPSETIRLEAILGPRAYTLTAGEKEVAEKVLAWAIMGDAYRGKVPRRTSYIDEVAQAIREVVVAYSDMPWSRIASSCRSKELMEYRNIMFFMLREKTLAAKRNLASYFGIERDHATLLHNLQACGEWLQTDKVFKKRYNQILHLVNARLNGDDWEEMCEIMKKVCKC